MVVDGEHSEVLLLANMVFQGTVLGPSFWNVYYADAKAAVNAKGFQELVYADDLNCWKAFDRATPNNEVLAAAAECQDELHKWGASNRVVFDPAKESVHVVSTTHPEGGNFAILGVKFDPKLVMQDAVTDLVTDCRWKLQQLLRGRRYFSVPETVQLYKAHLLSFLEYRTPALYHASPTALAPLDQLQRHFLHELGLTEEDALVHFALAPLQVRRDVAMLGVVHRAALRKGPPQLWPFFAFAEARTAGPATRSTSQHCLQLKGYRTGEHLDVVRRSTLGLVDVYNELPPALVNNTATSVKAFQGQLQALVLWRLRQGCDDWKELLSARAHSWNRPLRGLRDWSFTETGA